MFHLKYRGLRIRAQQSSSFFGQFSSLRHRITPNCGSNTTAIYQYPTLILHPIYGLDFEMAQKVIEGDIFLVKSFSLDFEMAQNLVHMLYFWSGHHFSVSKIWIGSKFGKFGAISEFSTEKMMHFRNEAHDRDFESFHLVHMNSRETYLLR